MVAKQYQAVEGKTIAIEKIDGAAGILLNLVQCYSVN